MIKTKLAVATAILASIPSLGLCADMKNVKTEIEKTIPNTKVYDVKESPIKGLYTVFTGDNVLYVEPNQKLIFFGHIYKNSGFDITNDELAKMMAKYEPQMLEELRKTTSLKEFTDSSIIKNENSKYSLVMFTNPHCPHCIQAENFLKNAKVTKYFNLVGNPQEIAKYYSASNPIEAYEARNTNIEENDKGRELTNKAMALSAKYRINGTPTFFVFDSKDGKLVAVIKGANIPELRKYIDGEKK